MANNQRAPKQWQLSKVETITSFENWRQNLIYCLSLDPNFAPFLQDGFTWLKKSSTHPTRDLQPDGADVATAQRRSAEQKVVHLELMLGQIANFCPVISRNAIVKNSTSLNMIWQTIRQHYGFQASGAHFLDLSLLQLQPNERPEDLYQRLCAFFDDNLLTASSGITHHGDKVTQDEDISPTVENIICFMWLRLVHPGLPQLVKQRYGAELRNKTIASIKPEISQALTSLLDELNTIEDSKVLRSVVRAAPRSSNRRAFKSCTLCKTAGRPGFGSHNLVDCNYLSDYDKRSLQGRARACTTSEYSDQVKEEDVPLYQNDENTGLASSDDPPLLAINRVQIIQSPYLNMFFDHRPVRVTLDTGATANLVLSTFASQVGMPVTPASQMASQADGITPLRVTGETHCSLSRNGKTFQLHALIVDKLDVDILAGNPFMVYNDVATRPAKKHVIIDGEDLVPYGNDSVSTLSIRRTQAHLLRSPSSKVVLPGDFIQIKTPDCLSDTELALEPRLDSPCSMHKKPVTVWPPPQLTRSVGSHIRIPNLTSVPIKVRNNEHFCQVRLVTEPSQLETISVPSQSTTIPSGNCDSISLDPDNQLPADIKTKFFTLHNDYRDVFNPTIARYNGFSGNIQGQVNMGPVLPPQQKGRIPQYGRDRLVELQQKFDSLESAGVFATPEQVNVTVEYLNPSFLINKPNGGTRLVTSFGTVAQYSKPQPSLMANVDDTLRTIASWKYIIKSDLLKSFYQIPLSPASMKYCGVSTPFKGIRVYTRCAMGMPGSETALEELMSRVLGSLIQEGVVTKIADDLYCGGDSPEAVLHSWSCVLHALQQNSLRLSASKTVICPRSTVILGWVWSQGTLQASPHRIAALSSVSPPATVQALRSFIGAYKVLSRVLRGYADLLDPLDKAVAKKESRSQILWTDELLSAFKAAQLALSSNRVITLPTPDDILWIVTDGSVKQCGIAASLYILRNNKLHLSGFFNAKLRKHQVNWLPCEVEALAIGAATKHFSPYLIQSRHNGQVLTDSRPCVQAYLKLLRGEFSASSRVTTFLSIVSRYQVKVSHISGIANLPSDYESRHPSSCTDQTCQVCKFIAETEDSVIRSISVHDILNGLSTMPFTNRAAWRATQLECSDLRRVHSHLTQGTRPSKKATKIKDIKRYIQHAKIASDGLLVVSDVVPFQPPRDRIIVPRTAIDGLLSALHLRFHHPSSHQMKRLVTRYFFALDLDRCIQTCSRSCHHCLSITSIPASLQAQTTTEAPANVGYNFAADIMRRYKQFVLVLRETVSSYTFTRHVESEKHTDVRQGLMILCSQIRPLGENRLVIRTDAAPSFKTLVNDTALQDMAITIEIGNEKNKNKNPVAERAIQELGIEILRLYPEGGPISDLQLAMATANLNTRIRSHGLSSREVWTQRDQVTGQQLPLDDQQIILHQHNTRLTNHGPSAKSKLHGRIFSAPEKPRIGDLIYLREEGNKCQARDRYLVTAVSDNNCTIRKFTKNQLRSKSYEVPFSDCLRIPSSVSTHDHDHIRGLSSSDNSSDDESITYTDYSTEDRPDCAIESHVLPSELLPITENQLGQSTESDAALLNSVGDNQAPVPLRRSGRTNSGRPPQWLRSGEWLYD